MSKPTAPRGHLEVEDGYGNVFQWPRCSVEGCNNGVILHGDYQSEKCSPHTPGARMAKCECGAKAVDSNKHADYCEVADE